MNQILFQYLNSFAGRVEWLDTLIVFCAEWLGWWMAFGFIIFLLLIKKSWRQKLMLLIYAGVSIFLARVVVTEIIRYFYYVPRPFVDPAFSGIYQLISHASTGSFPSGHMAVLFALAMSVFFITRKWKVKKNQKYCFSPPAMPEAQQWRAGITDKEGNDSKTTFFDFFVKNWIPIIFFLGAIFVGVARVMAGIHWPLDILAGAIIGILSAWVVWLVYKKYAT